MDIKILGNKQDMEKLEQLRVEVFDLKAPSNYFLNELYNMRTYALVATIDGEVVGGLYFHRAFNNVLIDQLFVKSEYRNNGVGGTLINRILSSKEQLEELFDDTLISCYIEASNERAHSLYQRLGFKENKYNEDFMHRRFR